jgi:hypothetical protein
LSYIGDEASLETQELFTETFDQAVTQISGTLPDIVSKSHFKSLIDSIEEDLSEYDPEYRERKDQATQKLLRSSESLSINEIELLTNIAKQIPRFREIQ